jgi:hypothetical protein
MVRDPFQRGTDNQYTALWPVKHLDATASNGTDRRRSLKESLELGDGASGANVPAKGAFTRLERCLKQQFPLAVVFFWRRGGLRLGWFLGFAQIRFPGFLEFLGNDRLADLHQGSAQ